MQSTIRFDKEYTEDLSDPSSSAFRDLESRLNSVVSTTSKGIQSLFEP